MAGEFSLISDVLIKGKERYGQKRAVQRKGPGGSYEGYSYDALYGASCGLAHKLLEIGFRKGDKVGILAENGATWAIAAFGTFLTGGAVVPLGVHNTPDEASAILEDAEASYLIVSQPFIEKACEIRTLPTLRAILVSDVHDPATNPQITDLRHRKPSLPIIPLGAEISAHSPTWNGVGKNASPSDPALIIYTSGTTGTPKGVVLSHKNILSNIEGVIPYFEFGSEDHFLSLLPLSHTLEFTAGFVLPLTFGATITYLRAPVASEITTTMKEVSPTVFIAVPLVYKHLHKGIMRRLESLPTMSRAFLSLAKRVTFFRPTLVRRIAEAFGGRMRYWITGGAPIDPALLLDLELMGIEVLQGYGLSEASPLLTVNPPGRNRRGTVGLSLTNVRVKIAASPGEGRGEILAQGDNVMTGYYRNRKATSEAIRDGWLHTGDVGILDEAGYLTIVGREKNMIVTPGGENVYPEEIETLLERCPLVKELSVFGQKEGDGVGEKVCAVIVPDLEAYHALPQEQRKKPVETVLEEEIKSALKTVAPYKRIAEWVLHPDELPKTPLRKKKMNEIRGYFLENRKQKTVVRAG